MHIYADHMELSANIAMLLEIWVTFAYGIWHSSWATILQAFYVRGVIPHLSESCSCNKRWEKQINNEIHAL